VVDGCNRFAERLAAVGSVNMTEPNAPATIRQWVAKGLVGVRIFTGGSTKDFDPAELEDPRAFPAWKSLEELQIPMCIQTGPIGLPQVSMLAHRFPGVNIILDHLGRPEVQDGPPYAQAQSLFALAALPNVYLKLTPRIFNDVTKGKASAATFFAAVVDAFGASRLAWGSNFPTSPGTLAEILATAQASLATLSAADREWIFGKTAQKLYPKLAH
jgi:predicted TIM-barrel fold metal-dependent hydrolase